MLVEILMILRESIKEDKAIYTDILNARDDFKK
jgi:transposase-like protein